MELLEMDEQLTSFVVADLMFLFKTHKACAACSSARMFFEPGTQRLKALQSALGCTDRTGEITKYLNSSSSNLELADRILEVLTDLKPTRAKKFEAFVAGTASRQFQKHMWQFLLGLATVTVVEPSIVEIGGAGGSGVDFSCSSAVDLSKMSFQPVEASTPMLAAPAAPPPFILPRRKAAKCLFQGDKCPGFEKMDTSDQTGSGVKQMNSQMAKYEGCLGSLLTSWETLEASFEGGKAAPVLHASLAATLSQCENKLESLRQSMSATIVEVEDRAQERLPSAAQLGEFRDAVCRLSLAIQQLSAALARPPADGRRRVKISAQLAGDCAAAATTIKRALVLLAARKGLMGGVRQDVSCLLMPRSGRTVVD